MILLPCPWCGPRDAAEFAHAGERVPRPDPGTAAPAQWRDYLYLRANTRGWVTETWYHRMGCRQVHHGGAAHRTNETRTVPPGDAAAPAAQAAG